MIWLFCAMLVMAFVEVIGVASIMPFMAVIASPEVIERNQLLNWAYQTGHFSSSQSFLLFLGSLVLVMLVFSNAFTAATTRAQIRFTYMVNYTLSKRLIVDYTKRAYLFFVDHNSANLSTNVLSEVAVVVGNVIGPGLEMMAKLIVAFFLIALLVAAEPVLAIVMTLLLGGIYTAIYVAARRRLARTGAVRVETNRERYRIAAELFSGIKEIKVLGREKEFVRRYDRAAYGFSASHVSYQVISQLPKYALEVFLFGSLLLIALYFLAFGGGVTRILPMMALYAMAGYRIAPALQCTFRSVAQIRFHLPAVDVLCEDLRRETQADVNCPDGDVIFEREIELEGISFRYPNADHEALSGITLTIPKNKTVAFVGATGSGKTTLVDLILGLIQPAGGSLAVDGERLVIEKIRAWQRRIGYVPQNIYLADDSIAGNIAFGIPREQIDQDAVERAARIANVHSFVVGIKDAYAAVVGERGIRLSGGQRQRIGIARALYHDPDILVLDEGTSALDGITEEAVMQAIDNLAHEKTILLVAHRLTTVQASDCIYLLEGGRIVSSGTYDELMESSPQFRAMARVAPSDPAREDPMPVT